MDDTTSPAEANHDERNETCPEQPFAQLTRLMQEMGTSLWQCKSELQQCEHRYREMQRCLAAAWRQMERRGTEFDDVLRSLATLHDDIDAREEPTIDRRSACTQLARILHHHGVQFEEVDSGVPFDPERCECVDTVSQGDLPEDSVVRVIERRLIRNTDDAVQQLRPAKVVVNKRLVEESE